MKPIRLSIKEGNPEISLTVPVDSAKVYEYLRSNKELMTQLLDAFGAMVDAISKPTIVTVVGVKFGSDKMYSYLVNEPVKVGDTVSCPVNHGRELLTEVRTVMQCSPDDTPIPYTELRVASVVNEAGNAGKGEV